MLLLEHLVFQDSSNMCISGKTESFTGTVTDKFRELQPVLQNITKTMHDFSKNTSRLQADSTQSASSLEKMIKNIDLIHKQSTQEIRNDLTQKHSDNMAQCRDLTDKLEKKLLENISKLDTSDLNLERQTKAAITALTTGMDKLNLRVEEEGSKIRNLRNFQSDVRTNLDMIRSEINRSVDVLTEAMEKNVTESLKGVEGEVRKLEERSTSLSSSLLRVSGKYDSLSLQSDNVLSELNKLKSHTQRSVDTSAGLRSNLLNMEGKEGGGSHCQGLPSTASVLMIDHI